VALSSPADIDTEAMTGRLGFWLSLDDDLGPFYDLAAEDEAFAPVAERLRGYHQVKFPSPTEIVCWAILVQRTQTRVAQAMKRRIIESFPENQWEGFWAFPDLDQLRSLDWSVVGHARKATYLRGAVEVLDEAFLRTAPYDEVKDFLLEIPGIGPWSAMFVLIRGLGRMDEMPPDREGLQAAEKIYGRSLATNDFEALGARYGRWRGYWGHYLRAAATI
jgi:DNA-3-methyladenine glycosylase II